MKLFVRVLQLVGTLSLAIFILLGMLIVLIQAAGIVTLNGALASSVGAMKTASIASAGVLGVSSFILSYTVSTPGGMEPKKKNSNLKTKGR